MQQSDKYALISKGISVGLVTNPVIKDRSGRVNILTRRHLEAPISESNIIIGEWYPPIMAAKLEEEYDFAILDEIPWFSDMASVIVYLRGIDSN